MILIEKLQKCLPYHQVKFVSTNILQVNKYCLLSKKKVIEQAKFTYSPFGKAFEKHTKDCISQKIS